ncbi:hypothetical protein NE237_000216 [Protea cynaroides]|uniref:Uncharacterized protein n=1 Tax=Protea cynaroides TaxID=273540 RepID=A0A9Q0KR31_9MAGN|nr:hypothetical protein NE237_000216 [Protea cynaroides]
MLSQCQLCAPTSHTGSFRCRLHRVGGDGQKAAASFYSKKNAFMVSGGCGCGGGTVAGGLEKGQKMRLSWFAKSACFGASQEDHHSGGETSISCS